MVEYCQSVPVRRGRGTLYNAAYADGLALGSYPGCGRIPVGGLPAGSDTNAHSHSNADSQGHSGADTHTHPYTDGDHQSTADCDPYADSTADAYSSPESNGNARCDRYP